MSDALTYSSGRVTASEAFKTSAALQKALEHPGAREHARDIAMYLYFVHGANSLYKNMPLRDRETSTLSERIMDPEWMRAFLKEPVMTELVNYYRRIGLTPGQRLYFALSEQMKRLADDFSGSTVDTDPGVLSTRIKLAKELLKSEREIMQMISEESVRKVRGGYEPSFMEVPPDQR